MTVTTSTTTTTTTTPAVCVGDRITVNPGALSVRTYKALTRGFSIEVTFVRREHGGRLLVEGTTLTTSGHLSGALDAHRTAEISDTEPGTDWEWFGSAPQTRTRDALAAELGAAYGFDVTAARVSIESFASRLVQRDRAARRSGRRAAHLFTGADASDGWQPSRGEPTEAGADVIRDLFAQYHAEHVRAAVLAELNAGRGAACGRMPRVIVRDDAGRGWYLHVHNGVARVTGVFLPGEDTARSLLSGTYEHGIDLTDDGAAVAGRILDDAAAEALFVSPLQPSERPDPTAVCVALSQELDARGCGGCASLVAQEFGEHPDSAVRRMTWARQMVAALH